MAKAARVRPVCRVAFAGLVGLLVPASLWAGSSMSDDDESAKAASTPNLYLDLRTNYGTFPAGSLSIGFGGFGFLAGHPGLSALAGLSNPSDAPDLVVAVQPKRRA